MYVCEYMHTRFTIVKRKAILMKNGLKKKAFTLAEVLITLAVIGVVAVLTIGIFLPKINSSVWEKQAKTAKVKFTKATEQMALNNKIGPYYQDTEEFVNELSNYLKISKVCKNDELSECFGYEEFKLTNGEIYSLSDATDGEIFGMPNDDNNDYTGDTIGLLTIDGTPIILSWNKKCSPLEPGVYQWSGDTNSSTSCIAALIDINRDKKPNKLEDDIILFNALTLKTPTAAPTCVIDIPGSNICWSEPFIPTSEEAKAAHVSCYNSETGAAYKSNLGVSNCCNTSTSYCGPTDGSGHGDRWLAAVEKCGGTANMPTATELASFATLIYQGNPSVGDETEK